MKHAPTAADYIDMPIVKVPVNTPYKETKKIKINQVVAMVLSTPCLQSVRTKDDDHAKKRDEESPRSVAFTDIN